MRFDAPPIEGRLKSRYKRFFADVELSDGEILTAHCPNTGSMKGCLEAGKDPAETIAIFRIPGAWEEEGFKILEKYGVDYCDRSVSMYEAAGRAVAKMS